MGFFGPSKSEIWGQLSQELGGEFLKSWRGDKVQVTHGDWTITLDTFIVMAGKAPIVFTRMRAPYVSQSGFRFSIHRRNVFTDLAGWFGAQDIEVDDPEFDEAFVIKSNDESRVREMLRSQRLRDLLNAQKDMGMKVLDKESWLGARFPADADELYFAVTGVIKDIDRLKGLYDLFAEILEQLVRVGAAERGTPEVQL
jgi:hypothetical protein